MFRLTREVRFAINLPPDEQRQDEPTNSYAGYPSLGGWGIYCAVRVTLEGELDPASQYVVNIKDVDGLIRDYLPDVEWMLKRDPACSPATILYHLHSMSYEYWRERFQTISLALSPFQTWILHRSECPMMRLSEKFEFSASHRLHNPAKSEDENRNMFGKCSNPH